MMALCPWWRIPILAGPLLKASYPITTPLPLHFPCPHALPCRHYVYLHTDDITSMLLLVSGTETLLWLRSRNFTRLGGWKEITVHPGEYICHHNGMVYRNSTATGCICRISTTELPVEIPLRFVVCTVDILGNERVLFLLMTT
jgi:hypothetical protein